MLPHPTRRLLVLLALSATGCARAEAPLPPITLPASPRAAAPTPLQVPPELLRRSRFEPSGLVWLVELDRYLLVSDDTGHDDRDERAPWLFTMDRHGTVDPHPLVVQGLQGVDDLESIARGEDGAVYALASQSVSAKGKRRPERRQFLRLLVRERELHLDGAMPLFDRLRDAPRVLRDALGLGAGDALDHLDIEGLAVDGAGLLLGLKAPGGAGALIWRLQDPAAAFTRPALGPTDLALFADPRLTVRADATLVPAGVADLLVLPDGALLVAVTAAGIDPGRQDGALYRVPRPPDRAEPRLLHTFPGDKPEGIALSALPGHFVVVFDRGSSPPAWITLPLPPEAP